MEHLELAELSDELDVAQHLPLRDEPRLLFFSCEVSGSLLKSSGNSSSILKLISALVKQQPFKGGNLDDIKRLSSSLLKEVI